MLFLSQKKNWQTVIADYEDLIFNFNDTSFQFNIFIPNI